MELDNHKCETMPHDVSIYKYQGTPWHMAKGNSDGGQYIIITHCPFCGKELPC